MKGVVTPSSSSERVGVAASRSPSSRYTVVLLVIGAVVGCILYNIVTPMIRQYPEQPQLQQQLFITSQLDPTADAGKDRLMLFTVRDT